MWRHHSNNCTVTMAPKTDFKKKFASVYPHAVDISSAYSDRDKAVVDIELLQILFKNCNSTSLEEVKERLTTIVAKADTFDTLLYSVHEYLIITKAATNFFNQTQPQEDTI